MGCCKQQMYKKNKNTAKINLPPGQAWLLLSLLLDIVAWTISQKEYRKLKRQKPHIFSFQPRVGSEIRANFITAYSVYLLFADLEMSYLFILYIYLFIYLFYFPPCAVRIRRPFLHFTGTLPQYSYNYNVQVHNYYTSP